MTISEKCNCCTHEPICAFKGEYLAACKARLPEPLADVLVHHNDGRIEKGWIGYGGEWLYEDTFGKITHWMPLPQPPKEDD